MLRDGTTSRTDLEAPEPEVSITRTAINTAHLSMPFRDRKRWAWLLSVGWTLMPLLAIWLHHATGQVAALGLPLLISFGLMPLADAFCGEDQSHLPEEAVQALEADDYYRWLTWVAVPLHFLTLLACAWWAATQDLPWWALLVLAYVAGANSGLGLNTGHELGHKHNAVEQWLARLVLAVPAYGHFTVEHGRGHHRWVATPEDHASARMGESIYRFALRELPGGVKRAWALERERLHSAGHSVWSWRNTIGQSYAITLPLQGGLLVAFGWVMLPFLAVHNLLAWWQLTLANYVQHYGLLRARLACGAYEAPQPHHSWNTNRLVSNLMLFHLQRHSDHHAHPSRRYQCLRHASDLPQLPGGYFSMFLLAHVPPLWFGAMNPRVLALPQVRGDLDRVNVDTRAKRMLLAQYGRTSSGV